jgi:hypothetical protein
MKRTLAVLGFSLLALNANAADYGRPFSQLEIDRALPNIDFAPVERYVADARAPYEQLAVDRALPNLPSTLVQFAEGSSAGNTLNDASATDAPSVESPFANQHDFIAPAQ